MSSIRQLDLSRRTYLLGPSSPFRFQCQYPVIKYGTRKKNTFVDDFTNKKLFSWGFPMFDDTGSSPCSVVVVPPTNFGQGTMTANDVRRAQNFDQV